MSMRDHKLREIFDGFCSTLRPSVVCDIGAFNGDESFRLAGLLPLSRIVAFEASPQNFAQFFGPASRFSSMPNFQIVHKAVSDQNGTIEFNVLDAENEASDWRRAANSIRMRADKLDTRQVLVDATRLDDHFGSEMIQNNTFALWIDVEGALEKVLDGAPEVLSRSLIIRTEVEWKELWLGQRLAPEIKRQLSDSGFHILADTYLPDAYDQSDILLINRNLIDLIAADL
jgi:FkbM family methyltransferase